MEGSPQDTTAEGLPIFKKAAQNTTTTTADGLPVFKKKDGLEHDFSMGYQPTLDDIKKKKDLQDFQHGLEQPQPGGKSAPDTDPHVQAIKTAQQQRATPKQPLPPKPEEGILDKISNALYLPAFNQGFNDLVVKPAAGATDFLDRTIDKAYSSITGQKTPDWLRKKGAFDVLSKGYEDAYNNRDKPKNMVSEVAEGTIGTLPLMASLFTGQGEVSLASKAPQFISKATKLLATTGAANAYKDATDQGKGYVQSAKDATTGAATGALSGLTMDAQMLLGGALGKGVVNKVVEKGLLKGGKAGEALIHALSTATVFGGTPVAQDLLSGKDVDIHEALKNFGMGLTFEAIPVAKGLNDEISDRKENKTLNDKAAQQAVMATAASNLHGESVLRTLMETPKEQLTAINDNIKDGHETLYANSIEQGMKAYDEKNPNEKRSLLADQLLLKTQGDVKFLAGKDNTELMREIANSPELDHVQKNDLFDKLQAISKPNEQTQPNTQLPVEAPKADASGEAAGTDNTPDEKITDNKITNQQSNGNEDEKSGQSGEESSQGSKNSEKGGESSQDGEENAKNVGEPGAAKTKPGTTVTHEDLFRSDDQDKELKSIRSQFKDGDQIEAKTGGKTINGVWENGAIRDDKGQQWGVLGVLSDKDGYIKLKEEPTDATKKIGEQKSSEPEHKEGNKGGKTAEASSSDSPVGAAEGEREEISHKDAIRKDIETEKDPKAIAARYHTEENGADYVHKAIIDYLGNSKINERDYQRWGDRGTVGDHTDPKMLRWIDSTNSDRTDLAKHAEILSDQIGVHVTPQDFIDVIDKYRGREDFNEKNKSETQKLLEQRYEELTGNKLTARRAEKAFMAKINLTPKELTEGEQLLNHLGLTMKDIQNHIDYEQDQRNPGGEKPAPAGNNEKGLPKAKNDGTGNAGKDRPGKSPEGAKGGSGKATFKKVNKPILTDAEATERMELRKKFSGTFRSGVPGKELFDKEFYRYAQLIFKEAKGEFAQFAKTLIDEVGEKIREHLPHLWEKVGGAVADIPKEEEKATYGTKNAITEELQQGLGLPEIEIPKDRTDDESLAAWKNGKRTPQEITEQLLNPETDIYDKSITPNDEPIMREYIRQLGERGRELNKIKVHLQERAGAGDPGSDLDLASVTQQINQHLDEYNNALNASKVGGNIWHKYGDERQKAIDDKGLIINAIERIHNIYGKDIPADVKQQLKDLQAKHDELTAKNEELQRKIKEGKANDVFEKAKSKRTVLGTKKLSEAEFTTAKKDILSDLKKDWKKSFASTYATLPGVPQFNAIAPHIGKLMRLYAERGISKFDDVVRNIHTDLKDDLEGITENDIKDIIAGRYSSAKPLSELQKQVNDLRTQARNKIKISELEKGIIAKTKAKGESSPEVKALQKQVAELKKKAINDYANLSADELKKQAVSVQKQIDKGEFFKEPVVKRKWETDPQWIKNNKEKADLVFKLRKLEREALDSKKSKFMRGLDWTNRWGRRVIFFGANAVYTKLSSAAVLGSFMHRLPEQVLGAVNAKMFPNIARTAPIEGTTNMAAEGKWYLDFVNPKEFAIDAKDIIMTGETRISKEMDTHPAGTHIPIVDLFAADGHQILKSTVKRATFNAAFRYQMDWYERNGVDNTHPMIIESARQAAWQRANYEVFQDNPKNQTKIKEYFNQLERSGILNRAKPDGWSKAVGNAQYSAAALYHFFIPINTVPVNILKRVGLGITLPKTYLEAISKNKSVREGILKMTSEESDALLLQLKKGQIGAFYWTAGFIIGGSLAGGLYTGLYPNKERDKDSVTPDSDYLNFMGVDVPKNVQHNTQFQALQMGATWRMVHDHYVDDKGESQMMAIFAASAATAGAAAKEHPVASTVLNIGDAIQTPHGNTKWVKDLRRRVGVQKAQDVFKLMGYDIGDDSEDFK